MEEWTELRDVVVVDNDDDDDENDGVDNEKDNGKFGVAFDLDFHIEKFRFDSSKERLRSLFDQVLVAFMREKSASKCVRPTPVLCGDGRRVDLYKLFWVVRKIGGYDTVSRNNLWGFVSEECGLGLGVMIPSVKLIYMKYLNELDEWLGQVFSKRFFEDGYSRLVQNLDLLSHELESRSRGLSDKQKRRKDRKLRRDNKDRAHKARDINEAELHISPNGNDDSAASAKKVVENAVKETNHFSKGLTRDDSGKSCNGDRGNIVAPAKKVVEKIIEEVLDCGENNGFATDNYDDDGTERFPVHDNNDDSTSTKRVVKEVLRKRHDHFEENTGDEVILSSRQEISDTVPVTSGIGNVLESRKRKRESESFSEMLNWLIHAAKHSDDPSVGLIPECSTWRDYVNEEFWARAMLVREGLLIKKHAKRDTGETLVKDQQKKPRMHPSMYEDDDILDHQSTEKLRCSKRISSSTKSYLCPCCISRAPPQSKDITHQNSPQSKNATRQNIPQSKNITHQKDPQSKGTPHQEEADAPSSPIEQVKSVLTDIDELPKYLNDHKSKVSVGPLFQAEVPEWTGKLSESDPKWLGKRMWAPQDGDKNSVVRSDGIGKGRQHHSCNCPFQDSVECVRFHIAEKRLKLKLELGNFLFYNWRFNHMGEEVSLFWTEEEVKRFKCMTRSYAPFSNKFWKNAPKSLPLKTRENLVSYYFNVFLIERRSYQNRVNPRDVDSDDDEKECGLIGASFGYKALYIPGPNLVTCTLNMESTEFE
ncbi:hypothetical protein ABFS82_05G104700 [Erythranthe guttata]|uniref:ARID domain-containing protein n=1 Tax=Erythranthe guttata TaxID=4155 RepID=A0A022RHG5_ERYGU|nr:PREDICTED: AT-rich interactive domain-containing protein 2 [Erythranthe guttata]EYU38330.1 hypothetical protein MIMGU_mgv1a001780mg [Erythranthe guttata]|eukprot:XP_012836265.1 PREDICTED: AT-rich interactive domain-containing protein 2 [Erythranthe guttata]